jgi:Xaa-Pro aminopeptidase
MTFHIKYLILFSHSIPCTARTFPVNGTFTPPQRDLYAALLATQKALVKECAVSRGHSLETLHRRSVDLLRAELERIGLPCPGSVLERVLYPHYLTHPIGIGEFLSPYLLTPLLVSSSLLIGGLSGK